MGIKEDLANYYVRKYSLGHSVVVYGFTIILVCILTIELGLPTLPVVLILGGALAYLTGRPEGALMLGFRNSEVILISGAGKGSRSAETFNQSEFIKIREWRNWIWLSHPARKRSFFVYRNWNKGEKKFKLLFSEAGLSIKEIPGDT